MNKVQELKEKLGDKAKDIIVQGLDLEEGMAGKYVCPMHVEDTASLSWYEQGHTFKCFGCGGTLDIYTYFTKYKGLSFNEAVAEVASILGESLSNIDISVLEGRVRSVDALYPYLNSRNINIQGLDLGDKIRIANVDGYLSFIHYNEFGIDGIRYRRLDNDGNKYWLEEGSTFGFWMKDILDVERTVIITEGEIDNLSLRSLGMNNITNYCSSSNVSALIRKESTFLRSLTSVVLIPDNDEAGSKAQKEFEDLFKENSIDYRIVKFDTDINNAIMDRQGEKVHSTIVDAIESLKVVEDVEEFTSIEYKEWDNTQKYGVEFGIPKLDYSINDMAFGTLSVFFGRTGAGKTTLVGQSLLSSVRQGFKTSAYNGELSKTMFQEWVYTQSLQDKRYLKTVQKNKRFVTVPKKKYKKYIDVWLKDKLYMYHRKRMGGSHGDVLDSMVKLANKGIKYFVVDNLMSVLKTSASTQYSDQRDFVQQLKDFAVMYDVAVLLVAHPNKNKSRGERLTLKDISGSGDIFNIADNVISLERAYEEFEKNIDEYKDCDGVLRILKARETADLGYIQLKFNEDTRTFEQLDGKTYGDLGWESMIKDDEQDVDNGIQLGTVSDEDMALI